MSMPVALTEARDLDLLDVAEMRDELGSVVAPQSGDAALATVSRSICHQPLMEIRIHLRALVDELPRGRAVRLR